MMTRSSSMAWAAVLAGACLAAAPVQAATLVVQGGKLMGARGVNVGGMLYDVSFVGGTCASAFGGCDDTTDFAFPSLAESDTAAQALLDQVFLDGPAGAFDTETWLVNGCDGADFCQALVPYAFQELAVNMTAAFNNVWEIDDVTTFASLSPTGDIGGQGLTFAVFSPAGGSAVPEPGTWAMMIAGFVLIGASLRRQRATVRYGFA